jgi:hypothetical protein
MTPAKNGGKKGEKKKSDLNLLGVEKQHDA